MAQPNKPTTGNVTDVPKPEQPKWVSTKEAEQFAKYLQKAFVPKDDEAFAKKYFYRPISIIPYTPADISAGAGQTMYNFLVQKYHRNKMKNVSISDGKGGRETVSDNEAVEGHVMNKDGFFECVDDSASMLVDARFFKENYVQDKAE